MESSPRLSYFHKVGTDPLRAITIGGLLEKAARKFPDREAIVGVLQNKRMTYKDLLEEADRFSAGLLALGMEKGDRLGLWGANLVEWFVVNMACARAGFLMVAINMKCQTNEIKYYVNKVGITFIVCPYKNKYQNYYDVLTKLNPKIGRPDLKTPNNNKIPSLKGIVLMSDEDVSGTYKYTAVMEMAGELLIQKIKNEHYLIQPGDPCYIQFSSGTTDQPKAAVTTHFQIANSSFEIGKRNELGQKHHKICVQVPLFHTYGTTVCLAAALNFGATVVIASPTYNPAENLKALISEECTSIYGTPTMFIDLIQAKIRLNLNVSVDLIVTGGAPCSTELFSKMKNILNAKKIKSIYGLTELSAVCFQSLPIEESEYTICNTVGHLSNHLEAKVVDADNRMVPMGSPGELCIRGYTTMLGYWKDKQKTEQTIDRDGWLHTGDKGILQENGYARIVGRIKDIILRGGENIYPKEVEDLLDTHPNIVESQVIGIKHERLGEEVCACVILKQGTSFTQEMLREFCQEKIAFQKIPTQLKVMKEFPKTESGKIQKYKLRQQFEK